MVTFRNRILIFLYFNSIKVRLERELFNEYYDKNAFQFHKGAIRTVVVGGAVARKKAFQFHKGAIRTTPCKDTCLLH